MPDFRKAYSQLWFVVDYKTELDGIKDDLYPAVFTFTVYEIESCAIDNDDEYTLAQNPYLTGRIKFDGDMRLDLMGEQYLGGLAQTENYCQLLRELYNEAQAFFVNSDLT